MGGEDAENYGKKRKRHKICSFSSSLLRVILYEGEKRYESKVYEQTNAHRRLENMLFSACLTARSNYDGKSMK